jgi:hypothetical protein
MKWLQSHLFSGIHLRVRAKHLGRQTAGCFNLYERAFVHTRTAERRLIPRGPILNDFGPIRKHAALHGLDGMNRTAIVPMKQALAVGGLTKP